MYEQYSELYWVLMQNAETNSDLAQIKQDIDAIFAAMENSDLEEAQTAWKQLYTRLQDQGYDLLNKLFKVCKEQKFPKAQAFILQQLTPALAKPLEPVAENFKFVERLMAAYTQRIAEQEMPASTRAPRTARELLQMNQKLGFHKPVTVKMIKDSFAIGDALPPGAAYFTDIHDIAPTPFNPFDKRVVAAIVGKLSDEVKTIFNTTLDAFKQRTVEDAQAYILPKQKFSIVMRGGARIKYLKIVDLLDGLRCAGFYLLGDAIVKGKVETEADGIKFLVGWLNGGQMAVLRKNAGEDPKDPRVLTRQNIVAVLTKIAWEFRGFYCNTSEKIPSQEFHPRPGR